MGFRTFESCSVRSSKMNTCRNNLFACRFAHSQGHSCMQMRYLKFALRVSKHFKVPGYTLNIILRNKSALAIGILYNLHLLSNSSPAKTWLSTRKQDFLFHIIPLWWWRFSSESKEPWFRLLEIEADLVMYIQSFSNKPGSGKSGWSVRNRN